MELSRGRSALLAAELGMPRLFYPEIAVAIDAMGIIAALNG
jgi:hypothetical protein